MTPYNVRNALAKSAHAGRNVKAAVASGGVQPVDPVDLAVVVFDSTGARTLEAASGMGLGQRVLCIATVSGVSVNSVDIADGDFIEFIVGLDASAAQEWQLAASNAISENAVTRSSAAASAGLVPVSGGADRSIGAATPADLGTVNINTGDANTDTALIALANALAGFGLVTHTWT